MKEGAHHKLYMYTTMRIFQKLNVYQKNTSNPVKQYTYIVKTTREIKEQN